MRKGALPVVYRDIVVLAPCAEIDGLEDSGVLAVTDLSGIPVSWAEASQLLNVTDTSPTAVLYRYLFARAANEQRSATVVTLSTTFDPVATGAEEFVVAIRALMASFAKESGYGTIFLLFLSLLSLLGETEAGGGLWWRVSWQSESNDRIERAPCVSGQECT